jgi:spore coat polysaccharide biosynthesis protein SpsF
MAGAGIILQARFASSRLPGKALALIAGRTVLEHCLRRLRSTGVAPVVLATTRRPEDDALAEVAAGLGVDVYRGETDDVLGRFLSAADSAGFDLIVRATGDNPGTDIEAPARLLAAQRESGADYVWEDGLPYGGAVEVVTRGALARAAGAASAPDDREHVTPYIRRNTGIFSVRRLLAPAAIRRPDLRMTVDTPEDLDRMRALFARTRSEMPSLRHLIVAAGPAARRGAA